MGNRATVIFDNGQRISPAIYLHWNGGPESVYAFLGELDRRGVRADSEYDAARFVQLIGEFFDGREEFTGLSLGIVNGPSEITADALDKVESDHGDNGFYVVNRENRTMRRFYEKWSYDPVENLGIHEMSTVEVGKERDLAVESQTYTAILKGFRDQTEGYKVPSPIIAFA
jgi:hypothetical protein